MYGILKSNNNADGNGDLAAIFMAPLTIRSNVPGFAQDTVNLKRRSNRTANQRWELEAGIQPTNHTTDYFVHSVVNLFDTVIYIKMPQLYVQGHGVGGISRKTPVGAPISDNIAIGVSADYPAGTATMDFTGLSTYDMMSGEFIQFGSDPKIYMVSAAGVNGVGVGIYPSLRRPIPAGTQVIYGDRVVMHAFYDNSNTFGIKYSDGILTDSGSATFVEAL